LRICIAEDNPVNQKIAVQFMKKLGFKYVDAYDNGQQAVEGLREKAKAGQPYHIVLMDVQMPVLDGYEATKLIRRDPIDAVRSILVIAMTASAIQGDREKCLESGMNDYLAKPVRSNVLKKKLDQYIRQVCYSFHHSTALDDANIGQPLATPPNLQAETKLMADKILREMNGSTSPSMLSSSSQTSTPRLLPQNSTTATTPFLLSTPLQLANHNHTSGSDTDVNVQVNIGKMPRHEEEASLKGAPSKLRAGKLRKSENEPLSVKERSNSVVGISEDVDGNSA
jgi:CheY-like chemotaxis protein